MKITLKSKIFGSFVLLAIMCIITACASGSSTTTEGDNGKVYTLKYNTAYPAATAEWEPKYSASIKFAELVEERTNGQVKIELYHNSQLAGQEEALDALARGTYDIQMISPAAWGSKIPEAILFNLPYGWLSEEQGYHLLHETEVGKLFEESLEEYGVKVLNYWYSGDNAILSNAPISGPDDFKGLTINAYNNIDIEQYKFLGAGIASVPFAEQYEGLMRGTIDGIAYPPYTLESYKFAEVVDYVTVPYGNGGGATLVAVSKKNLEKLPDEFQQIIMDTALEMEKETIEQSKQLTKRGIDYAKDNGLEIITITNEDYEKLAQITKDVNWKIYENYNNRTKRIAEVLEEEMDKWLEDHPDAIDQYLNINE